MNFPSLQRVPEVPPISFRYNILFKLQLGCYPVAVVQYTFTHKQYTERHKKKQYTEQQKFLEECGPCPVFASAPFVRFYYSNDIWSAVQYNDALTNVYSI